MEVHVKESIGQATTMLRWAVADALSCRKQRPLREQEVRVGSGRYECRIASDRRELREVFKLRYRIYRDAFGSPPSVFRIDLDEFDRKCLHLVVFDRETRRPVGTYRLNTPGNPAGYYSAREFSIDPLLRAQEKPLELGRACVDPDHRNGAVIRLLWKGLMKVAQQERATLLFGCSSVPWPFDPPADQESGRQIFQLKMQMEALNAFKPIPGVAPCPDYALHEDWLKAWQRGPSEAEPVDPVAIKLLPPLLLAYFRAGARIVSTPAWDRDYHCLDLLTVIPVELST